MDLETIAKNVSWRRFPVIDSADGVYQIQKNSNVLRIRLTKYLRATLWVLYSFLAVAACFGIAFDSYWGIIIFVVAVFLGELFARSRKDIFISRKDGYCYKATEEKNLFEIERGISCQKMVKLQDVCGIQVLMYAFLFLRIHNESLHPHPTTKMFRSKYQISFVLSDLSRVFVVEFRSYEKAKSFLKEVSEYTNIPVIADSLFTEDERRELTSSNGTNVEVKHNNDRFTKQDIIDEEYWQLTDNTISLGDEKEESFDELSFSWRLKSLLISLILLYSIIMVALWLVFNTHNNTLVGIVLFSACYLTYVDIRSFCTLKTAHFNKRFGCFWVGPNFSSVEELNTTPVEIKSKLKDIEKL